MSVVSLSSSSPISPYSPSALTRTIPSTPTAEFQAPSDQVISRGEFDSLKAMMITMASDSAALRSGNKQAHSDSVPQPSLVVPSTSGVDSLRSPDCEPTGGRTILSLVEGFAAPEGESRLPESCPMEQQETLADRSRKRSREPKDSAGRAKRQRAPSRERGSAHASPAVYPSQRHAHSAQSCDSTSDLGAVNDPVPLSSGRTPKADGSFSASMILTLNSLINSAMTGNPKLTNAEALDVAKKHLRTHDPLNLSYTSARSGRGAQAGEATPYVTETPHG